MKGPENTFIGSVHKHLPVGLYHMKNHNIYNGGIFDCWYSGARDLWVEYKFINVPVRDATVINLDLSELQIDWGRSRHAEGRKVGVIVGCKAGGVWFPDVEWGTPITAGEFRARTQSRPFLAGIIAQLCG